MQYHGAMSAHAERGGGRTAIDGRVRNGRAFRAGGRRVVSQRERRREERRLVAYPLTVLSPTDLAEDRQCTDKGPTDAQDHRPMRSAAQQPRSDHPRQYSANQRQQYDQD